MSSAPNQTQRILTGDTPTGKLHLGHWVGSVERRVELQSSHDCFFILANMHAFTTRADQPEAIRADTLEIVRDLLCMGIDPERASIFLQSEVPAIAELTFLFSMLLPFNRVMRNPTLKDEIKVKGLGENYPFGFPLYAVGQTADILAFRPVGVPVGEDQVPHLELTREVADVSIRNTATSVTRSRISTTSPKGASSPCPWPTWRPGRPSGRDRRRKQDVEVAQQRDLHQ